MNISYSEFGTPHISAIHTDKFGWCHRGDIICFDKDSHQIVSNHSNGTKTKIWPIHLGSPKENIHSVELKEFENVMFGFRIKSLQYNVDYEPDNHQ